MPFNFNSGNTPQKTNNDFKSDTNYTSNTASTIPRPSSREKPTFTSDTSSASSMSTQSPHKSTGFQNQPVRRSSSGNAEMTPSFSQKTGYSPRKTKIKPPSVHQSSSGMNIPWNILLPIIGIIAVVIFCWIFREEITNFLMQLLTWVIVILVIIFIVKWFIFPKKK